MNSPEPNLQDVSAYDQVFFPSLPHRESHPGRLAWYGRLAGVAARSPEQCRLLEIGCGSGGNLLPLAEEFPRSYFLGLDRSSTEIARAQRRAEAARLDNIQFREHDLVDPWDGHEPFDYIVAHGVYSWTTAAARVGLLQTAASLLAETGLLYLNYNVLPGWAGPGIIRDLLQTTASRSTSLPDRVREARRTGERFLQEWSQAPTLLQQALREDLQSILRLPDDVLFHAYLNVANTPFRWRQVMQAAQECGLHYLCDAVPGLDLQTTIPARRPETLAEWTGIPEIWIQLFDYARHTAVRRSLFCRATSARSVAGWGPLLAEARLAGPADVRRDSVAVTGTVVKFAGGARLTTLDPQLAAALEVLGAQWPHSVTWSEIADTIQSPVRWEQIDRLEDFPSWMLDLWECVCRGYLDLRATRTSALRDGSDYPHVSRLVRTLTPDEHYVANAFHEAVRVDDRWRTCLARLDGHSSRAQLRTAVGSTVDATLAELARHALVVEPRSDASATSSLPVPPDSRTP